MAIAEASSRYSLEDRASPVLRAIRQEGERTTVALKGTGDALDKLGSPQQLGRLDRLASRMDKVGSRAEIMRGRVEREASRMEGSIRSSTLRAETRLEGFSRKLDDVGRRRAMPSVDVSGVATARAELALLERDLNRVGRQSEVARVRVASSGGGIAGGGGRSGIGGLLTKPVGIPFAGSVPLGLLAAALPAAQGLVGAGGALLGSAGGGALGLAGTAYTAGLGTAGVGAGALASVIIPARKELDAATKAQQAYNQAVAIYGQRSTQAATAQQRFNIALAHTPAGAGAFMRQRAALSSTWSNATRPGQSALLGGAAAALGDVRRVAPTLANTVVNPIAAQAGTQVGAFGGFATSTRNLAVVQSLGREFSRDLPLAEQTAEHLVTTFGNLAQASLPFFHEGVLFVDHWTGSWATSTGDLERTRTTMGHLVDDARAWGHLAGAGARLIRDLLSPGQRPGNSMVEDLTRTLDRWDAWAQQNPGRIQSFFERGVTSTEKLAGFLGIIVHDLNTMATLLQPILTSFESLASIGSGTGLLIPTLLRYGVGRAMGGPGAAAAGGGVLGRVLGRGGGAAAGGGAVTAAEAGLAGAGLAAGGARLIGGLSMAERMQRFGWARSMAGSSSLWGGGGMTGLMAGARAGSLGLGGAAMGALGAASRFVAPIALIQAGMGAATTQGNALQRLEGAGRSLTFGIAKTPITGSEYSQQGQQRGQAWLRSNVGSFNPTNAAGMAQRTQQIQAEISHQESRLAGSSTWRHGVLFGAPDPREIHGRIDALRKELSYETRVVDQTVAERKRALAAASEQHGQSLAGQEQQAFGVLSPRVGPQQAMKRTVSDTLRTMRAMRPEGAKILGDSMIAWARSMAQQNPKLKGQADDLVKAIESRFDKLGDHVRVVNGQIFTGSRAEWTQLQTMMSDKAERARESVTASFTAIQAQAVGSLEAMGFSAGSARGLVSTMEKGGKPAAAARTVAGSGSTTGVPFSPSYLKQAGMTGKRRALGGGFFPGQGLADKLALGGALVAPGEGYIANRQTMGRLDAMLAPYGTTFRGVVNSEVNPHGGPLKRFAYGGGFGSSLAGVHPGAAAAAQRVLSQFPGLSVTSTTGGGHAAGSYHYLGEAVDIGGPPATMNAAASWVGRTMGRSLTEGIHNPNLSIKGGRNVPSSFWGSSVWAEHANHIHLAVAGALGALGAAGGAGGLLGAAGSSATPSVRLSARASGLGGVPGALADRAGGMYAAGLQRRLNAALATSPVVGGLSAAGFSGGGTAGANQALGRRMMLAKGWGPDQWGPLKSLWTRESGWSTTARNPSSGAYGIPQALGHGDIGSTAPQQIAWGLNYIGQRYGSPAAAWAHELASGWYGKGGNIRARRPALIGVGDHPRGEDVSIRPSRIGPERANGAGGRAATFSIVQNITVNYGARGDFAKAIRAEMSGVIHELIDELDHGVAEDEGALLR